MIRDTSAQDRVLSSSQTRPAWRRWVWPAAGGALLLAGIVFAARGWLSGTASVDGARLRFAEVTRGDETFLLTENQSTYIPIGVRHRLRNPGRTPLEMIEVQSGSYLGEDDIVRFEDNYGREGSTA